MRVDEVLGTKIRARFTSFIANDFYIHHVSIVLERSPQHLFLKVQYPLIEISQDGQTGLRFAPFSDSLLPFFHKRRIDGSLEDRPLDSRTTDQRGRKLGKVHTRSGGASVKYYRLPSFGCYTVKKCRSCVGQELSNNDTIRV